MKHTINRRRRFPVPYAFSKPTNSLVTGKREFLFRFVRWSWIVLGIVSILQLSFFWSWANAFATGIIILAWKVTTRFFLRRSVLNIYPLSAFLVIGFTATQFYFPLVFTLLEGKPVIFNMDLPFEVFIHSFLGLAVLLFAHLIYRSFSPYTQRRTGSVLLKAGFFTPPTQRQLWLMGFTGLAAMYFVYFYSPSEGREVSGAGDKFIQGLIVFSYAPFFIPFGRLYGSKKVNLKVVIPMLILFTILLFLVSLGRNSRGAFMLGFTAVGFAYGLGLLLGMFKTRFFTMRNIVIAVLGVWFFTGPLSDLATAMVLVRGLRNDTDRSELIRLTLEAYQDKEAIRTYKLAGLTEEREWDEEYMDNIFLARFSNLKYVDASLAEASRIRELDADMFRFTTDRIWATLPEPALSFFGVDVDKSAVNACSFGDFLHYKAGAGPAALGGFRTGHFAGTGIAAFGWWYLIILGLGIIPVYFLYDRLFIRRKIRQTNPVQTATMKPQFSFCALLSLTAIFMFLPAESVIEPLIFIIRGCFQMFLLYFLVFHFTRFMSHLVPGVVMDRPLKHRYLVSR